jgi:hypothetical protein
MDTNDEKLALKEEIFRIVGYAIEVIGMETSVAPARTRQRSNPDLHA